ncbi:hypothetical protein PFISCL1PPCAC_1231, partial [Pristionchus fissidentatus]
QEFSFFLISFCIFLAQFLNLLIVVCSRITFGDQILPTFRIFAGVMIYTSDLFSIGPAYYTLLLPGPIRRYLIERVKMSLKHYKGCLMEVSNIIQLCYGVPGVFAYFLVIYAMFGVRKVLNRSFIVIFVITAAINIATWINSWLSLRMKREPLFFFIFDILVAQFYYDQNICVLMLTIDRFAVIHAVKWNT